MAGSEKDELLLDVAFDSLSLNSENVETHGLGKRTALSDSDDVAFPDAGEGWRAMNGEVLVPLLEPVVLLDVMQEVAPDHDGSLHFCRNNDTPFGMFTLEKRLTSGFFL